MDPANEELSESYLKHNIFKIVDQGGICSWSDYFLSFLNECVKLSDGYEYITGVKTKVVYDYGYANAMYIFFSKLKMS